MCGRDKRSVAPWEGSSFQPPPRAPCMLLHACAELGCPAYGISCKLGVICFATHTRPPRTNKDPPMLPLHTHRGPRDGSWVPLVMLSATAEHGLHVARPLNR